MTERKIHGQREWMMAAQNQFNILITDNWFSICIIKTINRVRGMVHNATFNIISVISWRSVLLVEENSDLPQVTDKLDHIMLYRMYLAMSGI